MRAGRGLFVALCVSLAALALLAGLARADTPGRPLLATVPFTLTPKKLLFKDGCGAAVDSRGDLYVSDYYRDTVDVFAFDPSDPANLVPKLVAQIAGVAANDGPCGLAVDSAGNVYVNEYHRGVVKYSPSAYPFDFFSPPTYGAPVTIDPGPATGVAVDPSSDDLYVDHRTSIGVYGAPVAPGGESLQIGVGSLADGYGLAVSTFPATAGDVYVADAGDDTVKVYDPAADLASLASVIDGAGTPQAGFEDLVDADVAIDQFTGQVFVVDNLQAGFELPAAAVDEFGPSGAFRGQLGHAITHGEASGVFVDNSSGEGESRASGHVYVSSGNGEESVLYSFGLPAPGHVFRVAKLGSGDGTVTSTSPGIACGAVCLGEFGVGKVVTLSAADDGHSVFKGWSVSGEPGACPGTGSCQVMLSADAEVSAEFEALPQQLLTVGKVGSGSGTVSSAPVGVNCGVSCAGEVVEFNAGSTVILNAAPAPHSAFAGWSVAGQPAACPGTGSCAVTLAAAAEVSAEFAALPQRTLSVARDGAGTGRVVSAPAGIDCGGVCAAAYDQGATVTLIAVPAPGSKFSGWSGGGCAGGGPCQVNLGADASLTASFEPAEPVPLPPVLPDQRTLAISVTGSGSGTVSSDPAGIDCGAPCAGVYARGARVTLIATADPESRFVGWSGCESAAGNRCTVTLSASRAVGAVFDEAPPLALRAVLLKGATATLQLAVPGPGVVSASGKQLKPATAKARSAGPVALQLALSKTGKRSLARHGKLKVKLAIVFKPSDGSAAVVLTKMVVFKQRSKSTR